MLNYSQVLPESGAGSILSGNQPQECTIRVTTVRCCNLTWRAERLSCGRCQRMFHPSTLGQTSSRVQPPAVPDLATRLRAWRMRRKLTQKNLSVRSGIARSAISRYEDRVVYPELKNIIRLTKALEISVNDLLEPDPIMRELMRRRLHPEVRRRLLETVRDTITSNG